MQLNMPRPDVRAGASKAATARVAEEGPPILDEGDRRAETDNGVDAGNGVAGITRSRPRRGAAAIA